MSQAVHDIWNCPPSLLWQPVKLKKKADEWPELRGDKLTIREIKAYSESELFPPVGGIQVEVHAQIKEAKTGVRPILDDLDSMLTEENEDDFIHRPTDDAYNLTRQTIENAYTHYLGSIPTPAIAPDGDGGLIVEWKSGEREVRLIAAHSNDHKSYIYSRGAKTAKIDYEVSALILAQLLRSIFAA